MPATAGRVRMPANNRVHSSAALQTHGIWQSAIGYDPYAPNKEDNKKSAAQPQSASNAEPEGENAYSFDGLLALARITSSNADEARGSCKKCGRVGLLTFQCGNFLSIKEDKKKDPEAIQAAVMAGLEKLKENGKRTENESDEEESESSDSDYDSEIEKAIAQKYGKRVVSKSKSRKKRDDDSDEDEDDSKDRRKGPSDSDSDDDDDDVSGKKRKKEKRRRKDESSDEDRECHSEHRKSRKEKKKP